MALSNPTAFKAMQSTRLDNFEEVSQPDSFFTGMLVSVKSASAALWIQDVGPINPFVLNPFVLEESARAQPGITH